MGACTPMRAHRVRQRAGAWRRAGRLRRACGEGVSVACHARNPGGGRCMRIGRQGFAGAPARIGWLRRFLVHFGRSARFSLTSRPLLSRFSPSSFTLVRRCSPVSRSVQPRFVAVRVRFVAVPASVIAEPVKCAPSSRGTAATRLPGRCREDADRAPRLYRRSYPRYYNPPIAEQ